MLQQEMELKVASVCKASTAQGKTDMHTCVSVQQA